MKYSTQYKVRAFTLEYPMYSFDLEIVIRCEWCDTEFLEFKTMNLEDILKEIESYNCKRVIFTGGEPALQDLATIGKKLKRSGFHLSIETNGTIPIDPYYRLDLRFSQGSVIPECFHQTKIRG